MIINYVNVLCIDAIIYIITYNIHVVVALAGYGQPKCDCNLKGDMIKQFYGYMLLRSD